MYNEAPSVPDPLWGLPQYLVRFDDFGRNKPLLFLTGAAARNEPP